MKTLNLSIAALAAVLTLGLTGCKNAETPAAEGEKSAEATAPKGAIVYFNLDRVLNEYDMANDLRSVVETKVQGITDEVNRRGTKLQNDASTFQQKIDKGLLTRSVAEAQGQKLQERQNEFQNYYNQKQQEVAEEQQVMMNQIGDAIKTFLDKFQAEKGYALIISNQGDILPAPVAAGDAALDVTDEILAGLNAEYVATKKSEK
ncbi:MAG: OmpH family outer membrane protein [Bacteroidales bacterium]|nr:OmpH family outer membrane protein [Bacteroidales bacterium]